MQDATAEGAGEERELLKRLAWTMRGAMRPKGCPTAPPGFRAVATKPIIFSTGSTGVETSCDVSYQYLVVNCCNVNNHANNPYRNRVTHYP